MRREKESIKKPLLLQWLSPQSGADIFDGETRLSDINRRFP